LLFVFTAKGFNYLTPIRITLAAQAESRAAVEVQATQWPFVTALVMHYLLSDKYIFPSLTTNIPLFVPMYKVTA